MPQEESARISFVCPEDYTLGELSDLFENLTILYDKLELASEGEDPFRVYDSKRRWNRGAKPDIPLRIQRVHYGTDLRILVVGATAINDLLTVLSLGSNAMELPQRWEKRRVKGEFEKMLISTMDKRLKAKADQLAHRYDMTLERLLEYVGPQLRDIYENRARRKRRKKRKS